MKLEKLFKVTFRSPARVDDLSPEQKVLRGLGFTYVKASTIEEAKTKINWKLPIESVECVGIIAEK